MRLVELHIKRYGHFSEQRVPLDGDGLQLLVGPNEAGKTTLLEFIREMLFGFAERNAYDFGEGRMEGLASMRLSTGQMVELRRHKGRKRTVDVRIDGQETNHDAQSFSTLLQEATPNLFRSVFAFGLEELAAADKSLGESVRTTLYGGGLANVGNPRRILDALGGEASKLFQERAKVPPINALCADLKNLAKQVKDSTTRFEGYQKAKSDLEAAEEEAKHAAAERQKWFRDCSHTKRLLKALPVWRELCAFEAERRGLSAPEGFPADANQEFALLAAAITRNEAERKRLLAEIEKCRRDLDEISLDPALLDQRTPLALATSMVQSVSEARRDLPLRQAELATARQNVEFELAELAPDWRLDQLSGFLFDAARDAALDALATERKNLDRRKTELLTQQSGVQKELQTITDELTALAEAEEVSALRDVLEKQEAYNNHQRDLARLREARAAGAHAIEALALTLSPPLVATTKAHELPAPPKETVAKFKKSYLEHERRVNAAEKLLADEAAQLDALEKELAALDGSGLLPTRESLARMRARRDAGWQLLRKKYVAGEDPGAELERWLSGGNLPLPDAYEEAVREADHYSDAIIARSGAVAKQEQVEALRRRLEAKHQALDELRAAGEKLDQTWHEHWAACGFVPLDADAMESWLRNHTQLRELVREGANQATAIAALEERIAHFEAAVRAAVGGREQSCAGLIAAAKTRVQQAEATDRARQALQKSQRESQAVARRLVSDLDEHARQEEDWQTRWADYLRQIGLPADWPVAVAQKVIARLTTAREKLRGVPALETRIEQMRLRLAECAAQFARICQAAARQPPDLLPEAGIGRLNDELTAAVKSQERHASLQKSLDEKRDRLREVEAELSEARSRRAALLQLAAAENDEEFRTVAERARRIAQLDESLARGRRELDKDRENENADDFVRLLTEADADALREEERAAARHLKEAEEKEDLARERVGSCRQILLELEKGDGQAAAFEQQLAGKRAQLAAEVDRYVPLFFAQRLLERAIKKFEQESQPAMLKEVSNIFASMTGGRYTRVLQSKDDDALLVRRDDERELEPGELSTGTREQLYLAIRLAYVLHYCGRAEPLPIVMDDVLANFDDDRALCTLRALGVVARQVQVLMFTCHPHIATLAQTAFPNLRPLEIGAGPAAALDGQG